jgi:hypothetical protein
VIDPLAALNARQYSRLLVDALRRDQDGHRLAGGFLGRIAEHALGAAIPGLDDAVEILADNGVVGRLDDGREPLREKFRRCFQRARRAPRRDVLPGSPSDLKLLDAHS